MEDKAKELRRSLRALHDSVSATNSSIEKITKTADGKLFYNLKGNPSTVNDVANLIKDKVSETAIITQEVDGKNMRLYDVEELTEPSNRIQLSMLTNKYDKRADIIDNLQDMARKSGLEWTFNGFTEFEPESDRPAITFTALSDEENSMNDIIETLDNFFDNDEEEMYKKTRGNLNYSLTDTSGNVVKSGNDEVDIIKLDTRKFSEQANLMQLGIANSSIPDIGKGRSF